MKHYISNFTFILFTSLLPGCERQKPTCIFIENESGKVKIKDIDSACNFANKLNNETIPLFIYVADSLPENQINKFYHFSKFRNQSIDQHVVLLINSRKDFNIVYSEYLKGDSLLQKRYDFGRSVYDELKRTRSGLELNGIYKKFEEIFSTKN